MFLSKAAAHLAHVDWKFLAAIAGLAILVMATILLYPYLIGAP